MSRNESGGDYDAPNDRSTASKYTAPDPYKVGKGPGIPAALPDQVFAALQAVDKPGYVRPGDLGLDASDRSVSAAIGLLADDDGCPLDIERWNGTNTTPTVWRVESGERRAVADGGLPKHIGRVNGLGEGPDWYRCRECGAVGDDLDDIDHHERCPGERRAVADGGSRYGYSWTTDTWYEVTEYVNLGDGDIQAQEKHEVDREEVPQDVLDATNERDGDLVTDGGQEPVKNREWITEQLDAVPVVEWDRFTVDSVDGDQVVTVYGWIDRDDEYKDFVWTRFYPGNEWCEYTTSSEQWTDYLNAEWFGEDSSDTHTECRRVENAFDVENCIELTGQQELATDAGQSDTEGSR